MLKLLFSLQVNNDHSGLWSPSTLCLRTSEVLFQLDKTVIKINVINLKKKTEIVAAYF